VSAGPPTRTARLLNRGARFKRGQAVWTRIHAWLFRRTRGRVLGRWVGSPVLVLEIRGRRSGKPRATPIIYARDGDDLVVSPANAGVHRVPAWWLNLQAAGEAVAVVGAERRRVRPRVVEGEERERLWALLARQSPSIDDYPTFTDREFPVVRLERVG
jgi:F420H(2)-dependent quinone reductase